MRQHESRPHAIKSHEIKPDKTCVRSISVLHCRAWPLLALTLVASIRTLHAQAPQPDLARQMQTLTETLARTQAQLEESQRQLNAVREQLTALQRQMAASGAAPPAAVSPPPPAATESSSTTAAIDDLRERQALQESQIATHEQSKVESASKYPVKVTGLLLFNGFVNTSQVNLAATPTVALGGAGSTGATVSQTILGFDARGPHLFGASSFADLRVDFAGSSQAADGTGSFGGPYTSSAALLRLRTAHAVLQWPHTQAFFALDRPIVSPDSPTSLAAVAEPALAWSGSLWTWDPQLGVTRDLPLAGALALRLQTALIDVADPPTTPAISSPASPGIASSAEQSRWPGVESRIALIHSGSSDQEDHLGIGGYFAQHRLSFGQSSAGHSYDSWAATIDAGLHLPAGLQFNASAYRGLALGGLGGGAYKDIAYYATPDFEYYIRPLDDVGGWAQLKERLNNRLEFNAAFGTDMVVAHQLRPYSIPTATIYQNLDANRTFTGNFIYSPSASLLFSLEYRRLQSTPVVGAPAASNLFGLAAGYKF